MTKMGRLLAQPRQRAVPVRHRAGGHFASGLPKPLFEY
jgi:hypothetical protein